MSDFNVGPYSNVVASIVTYSTAVCFMVRRDCSYSSIRTRVKAISACHSLIATFLTVVALSQRWDVAPHSHSVDSITIAERTVSARTLDDSQNPLISGKNSLANFVTAWEAGYLIYDTGALFLESLFKGGSRSRRSALANLLRDSPIFVMHHLLLASALIWLQTYVSAKREKGVKVIMAFFLMNASNPVLHWRWYRKKVTGSSDTRNDVALAAVFAVTRFGSVYWIVKKYAQYHNLGTWQSLRMQRNICQTGTGLLTGLNAVWWLGLIAQMARQRQRTKLRQI